MLPVAGQVGIPGTAELVIVLLVLVLLAAPALIAVIVVVYFLRRKSGTDERVEELEREVEELREERGTADEPDDQLE